MMMNHPALVHCACVCVCLSLSPSIASVRDCLRCFLHDVNCHMHNNKSQINRAFRLECGSFYLFTSVKRSSNMKSDICERISLKRNHSDMIRLIDIILHVRPFSLCLNQVTGFFFLP